MRQHLPQFVRNLHMHIYSMGWICTLWRSSNLHGQFIKWHGVVAPTAVKRYFSVGNSYLFGCLLKTAITITQCICTLTQTRTATFTACTRAYVCDALVPALPVWVCQLCSMHSVARARVHIYSEFCAWKLRIKLWLHAELVDTNSSTQF